MSEAFSFNRPAHEKAATRFMGDLHAAIASAAIERKRNDGATLRALAESIGMDKDNLSRILSGRGNPTAREIGALAHALGLEITIKVKADAE